VTTVLLVRHGLTATTGHVLTGWTPGIPLDDRGQAQAAALAARLAPLPLDAIVSSPLDRCQQTAAAIAATRDGQQVLTDDRVGECRYGDWTGQPLKKLAQEKLWRVVQAHPSAVTFPGPDGESMPDMQHRAVAAVREWNARLGKDATYLVCSHGDVIKAIVADSLGLHLDQCQRIQADPCSLTVIRYTPLRPFLVRMNDRGGGVDDLMPRADGHAHGRGAAQSEAAQSELARSEVARSELAQSYGAVGGGAGGADLAAPADGQADMVNGASSIPAGAAATSGKQSADTRG
jgi:probable phosphomutase (TIGR03848 family)